MIRVQLSSFSFDIPEDWGDITLEDDPTYPFTMARDGGVGVIQVSLGEWVEGEAPNIDANALRVLFERTCSHQGREISGTAFETDHVLGFGGREVGGDALAGDWYATNGVHIAHVTYVCLPPIEPVAFVEYGIAEALLMSARFESREKVRR